MRPVEPFSYVSSSADLPVLIDVQESTEVAVARMAVFGDLDRVGAYPLERAVIHVLREQRPAHLELDLAGVPFLDTGGLKVLLQCRADAQQLDCRFTMTNVQPSVYRVLEIVRLLETFGLAPRQHSESA
jgi:anti-sigma B factor antagonist